MLRLIAPFTDDVIQFPYEQAVLSKYRLRGLGGKRKQVRLGLTGASYRWATMSRHAERLTLSLTLPFEEREDVDEEADLFGLFVNAVSAIDCLLYAAYTLASIRRRAQFPMETEGHYKQIAPVPMARLFTEQYPDHRLTRELVALSVSPSYDRMRTARNHLAHRAGIPRLEHYARTERWMTWGLQKGEEVRLTPAYVHAVHQLATARMWRLMCGIDTFTDEYFEPR